MERYYERGRLLLEQGRTKEAGEAFRKTLADNPTNAGALALLGHCMSVERNHEEALSLINQAIGAEPNNPYFFYLKSRASFMANRLDEARIAADEGLRINPFFSVLFELKSILDFHEQKWESALENAERGLAIDAENVELVNLRAKSLVKLNRKAEAAATIDFALHKAPEDANSHANKAWVCIEQDQYDEALIHFREALRLDPTSEFAKQGLKEAIKAKNIVYRYILKYFLWMSKMTSKNQWGIIIGLYVAYRLLFWLSTAVPFLNVVIIPLIVLYILFAFATWIGIPLANVFLRMHPLGKLALTEDEKLASNLVGGLAIMTLGSIASFYAMGYEIELKEGNLFVTQAGDWLFNLSLVFLLMMIPAGGVFYARAGSQARKYLVIYTVILAGLGLITVFTPLDFFLVFALGIFAFSFLAGYLINKEHQQVR
ncbi:MAG: tetratricopeptide repeat protein [Saprospiraceae bacterium]